MNKKLIFLIISFSVCFLAFNGFEFRMKDIVRNFKSYFSVNQTQKIFIHTNKDNFEVNENIWFKAYIVNSENIPDNFDENLYVELISPESEVVYSRLLKIENGNAYGDFPVSDSLLSGTYLIRAYTNIMKNYDNSLIFTKEVSVNNPTNPKISKNLYLKAKKITRKADDFAIEFFAEGGEMVYGLTSKIAFKAINYLGNGIEIYGFIRDNNNKIVADFKTEHNGMGIFIFTPEENIKYSTEVYYNEKKHTKNFDCKIETYGYALNVNPFSEDSVKVSVEAKLFENNDTYYKTIYFIAQQNDSIKFKTVKVLKDLKTEFYIPLDSLNTGIAQLTLFNGKAEPRCERLIFINKNDFHVVNYSVEKSEALKKIEFKISNSKFINEKSFCSVSVIDTSSKITSANILSTMFLTSDLGGEIENPDYYLTDFNSNKTRQLDLVMLTNGWRRFKWTEIMSENIDTLKYKPEKGISITGKIRRVLIDLPSKQTQVTLTVLDAYNDVFKTITNDDGEFSFSELYYSDTLNVLIEALTTNEKDNVIINATENDTLEISFFPFTAGSLKFINRKIIKKEENIERTETHSGLHGTPDQVIYCDDLSSSKSNVLELIKSKSPGVNVTDEGVNIRNSKSFMASSEPLYLIDDIPSDLSAVKSLSVNDVERIEIIKSASNSAIYGSRAANGVIAIYTKRGFNVITGWQKLKIVAYYTPKEFYQPNFKIINADTIISSIYWNPNLVTDNEGKTEIKFRVPPQNSAYRVVLQGISENGNVIYFNEIVEF